MGYKKFSADMLFDGYRMLGAGEVLVTDEEGTVVEIVSSAKAGEDVCYQQGILCPGFINAHCHLELSHMKGHIPEHTGLVDFVFKVITERQADEAAMLGAIEKAEDEMLAAGIVAVGDICNNAITITQKQRARIHYHNFIEVSGFVPAGAKTRFDRGMEILTQHSTFNLQPSTLSPHAPYSISPELFQMINEATAGQLISIHNQETKDEDNLFLHRSGDFLRLYENMGIDISFFKATGKSSLQSWVPHFTKDQSIILVHNVTTTADDLTFLQPPTFNIQHSTFLCLCPNANLYITGQLPQLNQFLSFNDQIVLGTDSLASNHQLSILEEIKTLRKHFPALELPALLQWATSNGAVALRMQETLGSFEKGKTPGVLLLSKDVSSVKRLL